MRSIPPTFPSKRLFSASQTVVYCVPYFLRSIFTFLKFSEIFPCIDTGVQLFATDEDFTVIASFQLENFGELGLLNYSFIPVFSSMNYSDDKANCPGFDVGLILAEGMSADAKPVGGFITVRNYWE